MEYKSTQKYLLGSPQKTREVVAMIKKLTPSQALERLPFVRRRSAEFLSKVITTAMANARQLGVADDTTLVFKEIQINEGPRLKRWRAGSRGRAKPYKRRMSHIRVVLETKEVPVEKLTEKVSDSKEKNEKVTAKSKKAVVKKTGGKK